MRLCTVFALCTALFASLIPAAAQASAPAPSAPLPNPAELLQRALANQRKLAAEKERYECRVADTSVLTDSNGKVKKTTTAVSDNFYVNGILIERTLQKNGKDLTPEETKNEDERVMKETLKYSRQTTAQKQQDQQNQHDEEMMAAMMLTHGHRERIDGRSVLFYDIVPNPHFQAKSLIERAAQVLNGTISIDEQTGQVIDFNVKSIADIEIGWGLLANVHKGFWFHIHNRPEPDGVWLTDLVEGSGDIRKMLFFHPYFHFKAVKDNCRLYTATAVQVGPAQLDKKP